MAQSNIPADVWAAAEDAFDTMLCNDIEASGTAEQFRIDSITPLARAILAERERCAAVVDEQASREAYGHAKAACAIAAAIRAGGKP